ncbi:MULTISPECIES: nucleoside-diphosphate kinase [unclassified Streptomyces]|uniref:nucleoside-diphosphate kinase n=1 Tax=unclassified Streptomyces TaxID=2593676 RepID=UPI00378C25C7
MWDALTRIPKKAALYEREIYFREGFADAEQILEDRFDELMRATALMMLKPDGLLTGKLAPILDFLAEQGFTPVAAQHIEFTPVLWREMWRYQLTSATLDRLAVTGHVYATGPCLLLALRDDAPSAIPAAVRLSGLKGASDPDTRRPDSLRARLELTNRIINHLHVADEPADVLREIGLLLPPAERRRMLRAVAAGSMSEDDGDRLREAVDREVDKLYTLDVEGPLARLYPEVRASAARDTASAETASRVLARMERISQGLIVPWRAFCADIEFLGIDVTDWDLAVLGSVCVASDDPGATKVIDNPEAGLWGNHG